LSLLRANLGLITPNSPAHVPILAYMRAIDTELAGRAGNRQPGGSQCHDTEILPGPPRREAHMRIDMGGNYAEIRTVDDETDRTRLAVLIPKAEIVKLARAILDRS